MRRCRAFSTKHNKVNTNLYLLSLTQNSHESRNRRILSNPDKQIASIFHSIIFIATLIQLGDPHFCTGCPVAGTFSRIRWGHWTESIYLLDIIFPKKITLTLFLFSFAKVTYDFVNNTVIANIREAN